MNHVKRSRQTDMSGSSRMGTALAERSILLKVLGRPSYDTPSPDAKVTIGWLFQTPRGPAELRDYWWNGPTEWSIAARSRKAGLWLARHLRQLGINATTRPKRVDALVARITSPATALSR